MNDVLIETAAGVRTITLNRPHKRNAFTGEMYRVMAEAIGDADDDPAVRVVLIQANGDIFSAGNDLAEFQALNEGASGMPSGEPLLHALARMRKPLVAGVHGRAIGVGLTLLLHCDLVYVADDALLSCPFIDLALIPEAGSTLLLPARIGHPRAFALFALGETVDGRTAAAWGLANAALPANEVKAKAHAAAAALALRPPSAVALTKSFMRDAGGLRQRIDDELVAFVNQLRSDEAREALATFFERHP